MSSIQPGVAIQLPSAGAQRAVTLASHVFAAAAVVLQCQSGQWGVVMAVGEVEPGLAGDLTAYASLVNAEDAVVIPDVGEDVRFADAVMLPDDSPRLRFFAMVRLHSQSAPETEKYLCLVDTRPRQLRTEEKRLLAELAAVVDDQLELSASPPEAGPPADLVACSPRRDLDLSPGGFNGLSRISGHGNGTSHDRGPASRLEARVHELEEMNAGLQAALRSDPTNGSPDELDRARLEQLIEESSDFVGLATLDGKTYYLNSAGQRLVGLDGRRRSSARASSTTSCARTGRSSWARSCPPSCARALGRAISASATSRPARPSRSVGTCS